MLRRSLLALWCLLAAAAGPPARAADEDADLLALRGRVQAELRNRPDDLNGVTTMLRTHGNAHSAAVVALWAVALAESQLQRAVGARETQSKELLAHFQQHLASGFAGERELRAYRALEQANGRACGAVQAQRERLDRLVQLARERWELVPEEHPATWTAAEAVRELVRSAPRPTARAAVLSGLRGPVVHVLAHDLGKIAREDALRAARIEAVAAFSGQVTAAEAPVLRSVASVSDSHVRRMTYRVLAGAAVREAVDVLVERLPHEVGVPRDEIVAALVRLTGQRLGEVPRAWAEWWAENRGAWTAPPGGDAAAPPPATGRTRFFGLDVRSARVLFVLDRSFSMEYGTLYDGRDDAKLTAGERKISLARRELVQAIRSLADEASFGIVAYGTTTKPFSKKLVAATPENRRRAAQWVEDLELDGATNLSGALLHAFDDLDAGPRTPDAEIADTLVVLSDGVPNCGPIAANGDLLAELDRLDPWGLVTIHTVYLGSEGEAGLMSVLARRNGGQFVHFVK